MIELDEIPLIKYKMPISKTWFHTAGSLCQLDKAISLSLTRDRSQSEYGIIDNQISLFINVD